MMEKIIINGQEPEVHERAFVTSGVKLIGHVTIREGANIWYNSVLRGDINYIKVGKFTNIQDNSVVHVCDDKPVTIGDYVTIGHNAVIHGCTIKDNCLIGMGAVVLDGAEIGEGSVIGAGSVVTPNSVIPPNSLVVGIPAKVIRTLDPSEQQNRVAHALAYASYGPELYNK